MRRNDVYILKVGQWYRVYVKWGRGVFEGYEEPACRCGAEAYAEWTRRRLRRYQQAHLSTWTFLRRWESTELCFRAPECTCLPHETRAF